MPRAGAAHADVDCGDCLGSLAVVCSAWPSPSCASRSPRTPAPPTGSRPSTEVTDVPRQAWLHPMRQVTDFPILARWCEPCYSLAVESADEVAPMTRFATLVPVLLGYLAGHAEATDGEAAARFSLGLVGLIVIAFLFYLALSG